MYVTVPIPHPEHPLGVGKGKVGYDPHPLRGSAFGRGGPLPPIRAGVINILPGGEGILNPSREGGGVSSLRSDGLLFN